MASNVGGPPPTQELPDWLPKPDPAAVTGAPPPAPPPVAPPVWPAPPPSKSRVPLFAGVGVIALVLLAGGYWFLRDSPIFQPSASKDVVTPAQTAKPPAIPEYDRADRIVNGILAPAMVSIAAKHNAAGAACSNTGPCQAALESLEPLLAKAVVDIDSSDPPKCIATQLQAVRMDLSNMDKATTGAINLLKGGQDDYGRQMVLSVGQSARQLKVIDMPALQTAFGFCPRT
jgi:hypothetical protein